MRRIAAESKRLEIIRKLRAGQMLRENFPGNIPGAGISSSEAVYIAPAEYIPGAGLAGLAGFVMRRANWLGAGKRKCASSTSNEYGEAPVNRGETPRPEQSE